MSDRLGFSQLAASVAELQPMPCIVIVTKIDAVQFWAVTLVGSYFGMLLLHDDCVCGKLML